MKKAYEEYRDTGMLGGYDPGGALLRETESGEVLTSFRDTCYQHQDDHMINQREMLDQSEGDAHWREGLSCDLCVPDGGHSDPHRQAALAH